MPSVARAGLRDSKSRDQVARRIASWYEKCRYLHNEGIQLSAHSVEVKTMSKLICFLALLLARALRSDAFMSETGIQHTFVRGRLAWVKSQISRGRSVVDIARLLGVPPSIVQHELTVDRSFRRV